MKAQEYIDKLEELYALAKEDHNVIGALEILELLKEVKE